MPSRVGFEFRAGFLVPSRAWGSYPFSPFHRSTDYFLGTIGRVRMKGIYDRDFPIDDESAAIDMSNPKLGSIKSYSLQHWKTMLKLSVRESLPDHPQKIQACPFTRAVPKSSTKYRRKGVTFHQALCFLNFLWILYNQLTNKNFKICTKWNKIVRDKICN